MNKKISTNLIIVTFLFAIVLLIIPEVDASDDMFERDRGLSSERIRQATDIKIGIVTQDDEGDSFMIVHQPDKPSLVVDDTPTIPVPEPTPEPTPSPTPTPEPTQPKQLHPQLPVQIHTPMPSLISGSRLLPTLDNKQETTQEDESSQEYEYKERVREEKVTKVVEVHQEETHETVTKEETVSGESKAPFIMRLPRIISRPFSWLW